MILRQLEVLVLFALNLLQNLGGLVPDITLRGTKFINGNITVYQFTCATKFKFWGCTVEFLLNGGTYEDLRLYEKTCYNRYSICTPDICSCSDGCNEFKWNVTSDVRMENTSVECEGRIEADNRYYKANSHLMLQRNGIISLGSTVTSINSDSVAEKSSSTTLPALTNESNDIRQTLSTILSLAILAVVLLILIIVGMLAHRCYLCKGLHIGNMQSFCCKPYKYLSKQIKKSRDNSSNPEELECDSPKQGVKSNVKLGAFKEPENHPKITEIDQDIKGNGETLHNSSGLSVSDQALHGPDYKACKVSRHRSYRKKNEKRIYSYNNEVEKNPHTVRRKRNRNRKRSTSCTIGQNGTQRYNFDTGDESSFTDQQTGKQDQSSRRRSHSCHLPEKDNQETKRRSPLSSDSGEFLIRNGKYLLKSDDDGFLSYPDCHDVSVYI